MLRKVRFKNYKSFINETIINLDKTKTEILDVSNTNDGCLKGCCFFGPNASGKTNALNAIYLPKKLLFDDYKFNKNEITLFNKEKTAYFEYTYKVDGSDIVYYFEFDRDGNIVKEKLDLNGETMINRILNVVESYVTENKRFEGENSIESDILFLRKVNFNVGFKSFPAIEKLLNSYKNSCYMKPNFVVIQDILNNEKENSLNSYLKKHGDKEINSFLAEFDFPYRIEYKKSDDNSDIYHSDDSFKLIRKNLSPIPFAMESYGNMILISMLPKILTTLKNDGMIFIDEFSSGLHNQLEELLIKYINNYSKSCQLFFVSHSTNILKTSIVRPDQVYSVDFNEAGSYITRFSDEHPRQSQNLEKMYLAGVFNGIPLYNENGFRSK